MKSQPASSKQGHARYTVVIPVRDEADSIDPLVDAITQVADAKAPGLSKIVIIDDGSRDGTWDVIRRVAARQPIVQGIKLRRNFGKAAALSAGVAAAEGDVVITMDGDLQDDPEEIPAFLQALDGGLDVVSGWKKERHDPRSKTLPSLFFNRFTAGITGIPLHDFNCGFKAYRREAISSVDLYGELHRFIPVLADAQGYRIGEIEVRHHARRHGRSKYGLSRLLKGFIDLLTVLVLTRFSHAPAHLIGGTGVLVAATGLLLGLSLLFLHALGWMGTDALVVFAIAWLSLVAGILLLAMGLVAEVATYARVGGNRTINIIAEDTYATAEPAS